MSLFIDYICKTYPTDTTKTVSNYPPTDIYEIDGTVYVEIALAGFKKEELEVSLDNRKLSITSKAKPTYDSLKNFIHRGISKKQFTRTVMFNAEYIITACSFADGILAITLVPDDLKLPKLIPIN